MKPLDLSPVGATTRVESGIDDRYWMLVKSGGTFAVTVDVYEEGAVPMNSDLPMFTVHVYRPDGNYRQSAGVNWPAPGTVPARVAEAMAEALTLAVQIAQQLDNEEEAK